MINEGQQRTILRYGNMFLDMMAGVYSKDKDIDTHADMLKLGAMSKEQLVDGHYYLGFYSIPGYSEAVEALWLSDIDAFVFRKTAGPDGLVEALHYFHPYPGTEYLFVPFFDATTNEPQGESQDEQLRRPPAEHTA